MSGERDLTLEEFQLAIVELTATLRSVAPMLYALYRTYRELGFDEPRAFELVMEVHQRVLSLGRL